MHIYADDFRHSFSAADELYKSWLNHGLTGWLSFCLFRAGFFRLTRYAPEKGTTFPAPGDTNAAGHFPGHSPRPLPRHLPRHLCGSRSDWRLPDRLTD